jgi:hypothetical protein
MFEFRQTWQSLSQFVGLGGLSPGVVNVLSLQYLRDGENFEEGWGWQGLTPANFPAKVGTNIALEKEHWGTQEQSQPGLPSTIPE